MNEASNVNQTSRLPGGVLERTLLWARWVVFWERLWPALATIATAIGFFLAASWLGLWLWLPPIGRAIALGCFGLLMVAAAVPLMRVRFPGRLDGLRRLDRNTSLPHRPATAISDDLATPRSDPWAAALWRAHVERALAAARHLKAGQPSPRLDLRDPVAMRALALLLVVTSFIAAGGERFSRIAAAFDWHGVVMPANFRLDAWVSPPTYTAKAPVILPGMRPGEHAQASISAVSVPTGSVLVIRASGRVQFDVATTGGVAEVPADQRPQAPDGTEERRFLITDRGTAQVKGLGSDDLTYAFNAIPDKPPVISVTKAEGQPGGSLQLTYKMEDDYGVVEGQARFVLKDADTQTGAHPLYDAPELRLSLPQARVRNGTGQTVRDLSEHPWAGAEVLMTLTARDEANNTGASAPYALRLPERPFAKELARAIIEQRRELALDAGKQDQVLIALDALAMAPDKFMPELGQFLGLRSLFWQLVRARSDDDLREVVKQMWAYATMLEDGNMADAAARLKNAEEALRNALERGASDEELRRLMDELRHAMNQYLQALADELRKNPDMARQLDPNTPQLRSQDLRSLLDRLEDLAKSGNRDAARQMLDDLAQMMQNLQMGRSQDGQNGDDMMSMMDELGDMIRRQQQLRDRTYRQGQDQKNDQQNDQQNGRQRDQQHGQQGQNGPRGGQKNPNGDPNAFSELRENQQQLREQLRKFLDEMKKHGLSDQNQKGPDGQQGGRGPNGQGGQPGQQGNDFADADGAMGDAEGALGDGNADGATDGQGRAIDALRRGAQNLAQQLQQQGQGGPGGQPGRMGQGRDQQTDPLGRYPRGRNYSDDTTVKVPGEIDAQRARRIIEELRKRYGETFRPQLELDYIERLLKDY